MARSVKVDLGAWTTTENVVVDQSSWTAAATNIAVSVDGLNKTTSTDVALTALGVNKTTTETITVDPSYSTKTTSVTCSIDTEKSEDLSTGENTRPNILVINLDDCGIDFFGGVSQYQSWLTTLAGIPATASGGPTWPTLTNFQAVADEGVSFLNAYCTPNCSPGRACFQTGRYAMRHGVGEIVNDERASGPSTVYPWENGFMEFAVNPATGEVTEYILPKLLSDVGYRTACIGKWHLAVPNGTPKSVSPFVASRWWEDDPRTGLDRARIPWEGNLALGNNVPYEYEYTGHGWLHPIYIGWDEFKGTHSNLERMPNDDLANAWTEGQLSNGFAAPADTSGSIKPGYYNYLWYDSAAEAVTQETTYITTYGRTEIEEFIARAEEPWFVTWEQHAVHSPFGGQPDNGDGYSGCKAPGTNINSGATTYDGTSTTNDVIWNSARSAMEAIDWNLGQLKTTMGTELWDRTIVVIRCDNGSDRTIMQAGAALENFGTSYEANVIGTAGRLKRSTFEGGLRVPLIIKGPGVSGTAGRTTKEYVQVTDLFETLLALAGTDKANAAADDRYFDTYSFLNVLRQDSGTTARDFMYFDHFNPNGPTSNVDFLHRAVTKKYLTHPTSGATLADSKAGMWKFHDRVNTDDSYEQLLYRLMDKNGDPVDPYEQTNLATSSDSDIQAILTALSAKLLAIDQSEPSYPGDPDGADT